MGAERGPWLALVGTALSVTSSAIVASGSMGAVDDVLFGGQSGRWRLGLLLVAATGAAFGPKRITAQRLTAVGGLIAEAASGHAASSSVPAVATISFAVHLGAVGVWVFAIVASVLSSERLRTALRTFTPYAVGAAVIVALTGLANASLQLNELGDVTSTAYGRVLMGKVGAFILMAALGLAHYLLRRIRSVGTGKLGTLVRSEAVAAAVALALATTLVGFPNPPALSDAAEESHDPTTLSGFASGDALSVADASGPFVVGLTLVPPRPGPVSLRVDVLGAEAGDGLRDALVRARSASGSTLDVPLRPCGSGCFEGSGVIKVKGRWSFEVTLKSNRGPVSMEESVPLPTSDGSDELEVVIDAMESLRSARMREELKGEAGGPLLVGRYLFEAPDRMSISVKGSRQVIIDKKRFRRPESGASWEEGSFPGSGFTWPEDYYRSFWADPAAVRLLGTRETRRASLPADLLPATRSPRVVPALGGSGRRWSAPAADAGRGPHHGPHLPRL